MKNNVVACYIRVSTDSQTEYSLDAQLNLIKEYAKKHNLDLDARYIYKDEGISGRKAEKRPAFMEMIKTAKTKPHSPFSKILIHKFDRFSRNREDSIVYKSLLKKECQVEVISITEDFGDDKFSVILEAMLEAMAEYYSLNLSEEVTKGMTEKASRGEPQGKAPFGYILKGKSFIINPEQAKVIRMIYNDYANNIGFQAITKKLNKMLISTKSGNKWEVRTIEYILRNPTYKGYVRWTPKSKSSWDFNFREKNGIVAKGDFEPIIDEILWNQVNNKIDQNKEIYKHSKDTNNSNFHWAKKLIKCSDCGSTLTTQKSALQCIGYAHGSCNVSHSISYKKIEKAVTEQLKKDFEIPLNIKYSENNIIKQNDNIEIIKHKISFLEEKAIRLKNLYLEGIDTIEEYKSNKIINDEELKLLKKELEFYKNNDSKNDIIQNFSLELKNLYDMITDTKIDMKAKFVAIHNIIDYIIYDKKEETIHIYYK